MKFLIQTFDVFGAILSSKMTGDLRVHYRWIVYLFLAALGAAFIQTRL